MRAASCSQRSCSEAAARRNAGAHDPHHRDRAGSLGGRRGRIAIQQEILDHDAALVGQAAQWHIDEPQPARRPEDINVGLAFDARVGAMTGVVKAALAGIDARARRIPERHRRGLQQCAPDHVDFDIDIDAMRIAAGSVTHEFTRAALRRRIGH